MGSDLAGHDSDLEQAQRVIHEHHAVVAVMHEEGALAGPLAVTVADVGVDLDGQTSLTLSVFAPVQPSLWRAR